MTLRAHRANLALLALRARCSRWALVTLWPLLRTERCQARTIWAHRACCTGNALFAFWAWRAAVSWVSPLRSDHQRGKARAANDHVSNRGALTWGARAGRQRLHTLRCVGGGAHLATPDPAALRRTPACCMPLRRLGKLLPVAVRRDDNLYHRGKPSVIQTASAGRHGHSHHNQSGSSNDRMRHATPFNNMEQGVPMFSYYGRCWAEVKVV
mmetsp:Transcript_61770/g.143723  ORF Transcript_61770/g.143723 Transcript_61770/m.143723 type:complete len:211 (-) Transcript_61770:21-653(-)